MTKQFIKKVLDNWTVDTRKYRYLAEYDCFSGYVCIKRLEIEKLDTTRVLTDWKVVYERFSNDNEN